MSDTKADVERRNEEDSWATVPGGLPPKALQDACTLPIREDGSDVLPQTEIPPELIDHPRYRVVGSLGKGGMGAVYKAEHRVMKRIVALKMIAPHLLVDPAAVERFRREVEVAARLSHPNIVTAYDAEQAGNCHFLVMEFVEGIDLARYARKKGPLPVAHACHFIRQAALGLQHAHERGMVHRDIKPHNLMLTSTGLVKVMDFGLARFAQEGGIPGGLTGENMLMGTADYIAPEQAADAHAADIRADIYSLGCTLYHLLAGHPPFKGVSVVQKVIAHTTTMPPVADLPKATPEGLRTMLAKMMEKDPALRFQTPGEVARALKPFIRKSSDTAETADVAEDRITIEPDPHTPEDVPSAAPVLDRSDEYSAVPSGRRERERERNDYQDIVRRRKSGGMSSPWPWLIAGGVIILSVVGVLIAVLLSGGFDGGANGEVIVRSRDDRLEVAIRRDGKVVRTIRANTPAEALPPGEYELVVVEGAPELRGFTSQLSLPRGTRMVVDVRREGIFVQDAASYRPPPPKGEKPPP